jgi:hypothetical protein
MREYLAAARPLFVLVTLTGSFLLFMVQPLAARMALPLLGGAPNVWNSAMLIFQALLLAGYTYAHALTRLPLRWQAGIHLALLALAALSLPIALADLPRPTPGWEVLWVPALFALTIGPVFLLVSAQAPLMQRWFAAAPGAGNPYALYAASNLGSFAGLLAYPLWLEPRLSLGEQSGLWAIGYGVLIALIALAAWSRWNVAAQAAAEPVEAVAARPTRRQIVFWLALSAVPSGLMLSTTSLLTTDLMAMPLLWVIPLGIYLLSFSIAFSDSGDWARILTRFAPVLLLLAGSLAMISGGQANPATAIAMVGLLFVLSVALHARLYEMRPDPSHLTLFYLVVAAGGVIGGGFTALLAPALFDWVYEHPILLLCAAALLPVRPLITRLGSYWQTGARRHAVAAVIVLVGAGLAWALADATGRGDGTMVFALIVALTLLGLAVIGARPAFVAIVALLMVGHGGLATLRASVEGDRTRSYFGVYVIEEVDGGKFRQLSHGTTVHGRQWLDPARADEPTSYYGPRAGIAAALDSAAADASIGVVGLGAGTLACFRQPGQDWTFYEIDPQVLAYSDDGTFTFVRNCAPAARMVIGDARLELAKEPAARFDVLAIDAFSSDSIPLHLMTTEAFGTYQRVLADDGLLLVHVSNRFIDLAPMIAALTEATGWHGRVRADMEQQGEGLTASVWIALARSDARLGALEQASPFEWTALPAPARRAWTDDNASIVPLIRW